MNFFDSSKHQFPKLASYLLFLISFFAFGVALNSQSPLLAQDETEEAPEEPAAEEPAVEEEAPAEGSGDSGDDAPPEEKSFLAWMIEASGIFGAILLLLSFMMVALIMMNILQVRRDVFVPQDFVDAFQERIEAKDYKAAYEIAKSDESLIAQVLTVGMSRLDRGYSAAVEGMQEVGEEENMNFEHRLSYLALIASVSPMIGLMGTVYGMILSFQKIATATVAPKPSELADGISTALFTTLEGLAVAIPAMIAYSILRNRVARYMLEVGMVSEGLMGKLPMGKPKAAGGTTQTTAS